MSPHMYVLLVLTWRRLCGFSNWWSKSRIPAGEYHKSEVVVVFLFFVCLFFCSILKKKQQQQKKQELTIRLYRTTICSSLTPGGGGGGVLVGILGGSVPPGCQNPDPISGQTNVIFHTYFQTRPLKPIPVFRPGLSNPFRIRIFHFLSYSFGIETINTFIHSRSSLENHTRFQTKMFNVYEGLN